MARAVVFEQNERLLERLRELPRRVQDEVWSQLPHYLHSVLRVSWLADSTAGVSALLSSSWRKQPMSLSLQEPARLLGLDPAVVAPASRLLYRLLVRPPATQQCTDRGEVRREDAVEVGLDPQIRHPRPGIEDVGHVVSNERSRVVNGDRRHGPR
jgi:hypothetical protein